VALAFRLERIEDSNPVGLNNKHLLGS